MSKIPDNNLADFLRPKEEVWARRVAELQTTNEDLVKLLGLINDINRIAAEEGDLGRAAVRIAQELSNALDLGYCALYVVDEGRGRLAGEHGAPPVEGLREEIEEDLTRGKSLPQSSGELKSDALFCMPLSTSRARLGSLAILPLGAIDERRRRHLRLVVDSVTPILENFLLRNRADQLNRHLEEVNEKKRVELLAYHQRVGEAQAQLSQALNQCSYPLFITDGGGRVLRANPALETLMGQSEAQLWGRESVELMDLKIDWPRLARRMTDAGKIEIHLKLGWSDGASPPRVLEMTPVMMDGMMVGAMGHLLDAKAAGQGWGSRDAMPEDPGPEAEMLNDVNNLLAAISSFIELVLMEDLPAAVHNRLVTMQKLAAEGGQRLKTVARRREYGGRDITACKPGH